VAARSSISGAMSTAVTLGLINSMAVMGRAIFGSGHVRKKMAWLMPRVARAVPYLGFILVSGTRPVTAREA
jgi:hypothetical protein